MVTTNQRHFYDYQNSLGGLERDDDKDPHAGGFFDTVCCGPLPSALPGLHQALKATPNPAVPDGRRRGKGEVTEEEMAQYLAWQWARDKTFRLWTAYNATPEDLVHHWTEQGWHCHIYKAKTWKGYVGPRFMAKLKAIVVALPADQPRWTMTMVSFHDAVVFGSVTAEGIAPFKEL